jgi:ribose transport system permease protein
LGFVSDFVLRISYFGCWSEPIVRRTVVGLVVLLAGMILTGVLAWVHLRYPSGRAWIGASRVGLGMLLWGAAWVGLLILVKAERTRGGYLGRLRWEARDLASVVTLSCLLVFFVFAAPGFLHAQTLQLVLGQGAVQAIVAVGLTYVLICGEIDLAVGMLALWAACLCGWLFEKWGLFSWWLCDNWCGLHRVFLGAWTPKPEVLEPASGASIVLVLLLPLVAAMLLGLVSGVLTVWSRLPSFIVTLAMMFIAEGMSQFLTKSQSLRLPATLGHVGNDAVDLGRTLHLGGGWADLLTLPYSAILAAGLLLAGHLVLQHTRFGRYAYMTGGNREAARLAGVRTGAIIVACLAISAVTAGVGGLVNSGRLGRVDLSQNKDLLLNAVACVVLGGTSLFGGEGGMGKTLIGVLTFNVLRVGLMKITWIDDMARQLLTGIVLMAALVINGILGKRR